MVIDNGKLIALLVEKTGRSKEDVQNQLQRLTEQVKQTAESGRQFHIEGFGTFGQDEGDIYFDPSSQLKTEINQKYTGMKPIELMAAFKETGAGVPVDDVEKAPLISDQPGQEQEPETKIEPKKPKEPDHEKEPAGIEQTYKEQVKPEQTQDEKPAEETSKSVPVAPEKRNEKKPPKKQRYVAKSSQKTDDDPIGKILVAAVVLIVLFVAGWLLYDSGVLNMSVSQQNGPATPGDTTGQQLNHPVPATADSANISSGSAEQKSPRSVSGNRNTTNSAGGGSAYGLTGKVNEQAENVYTIVIHSFRLRATVEEIADSLDQQGYRTLLFQGEPYGNTRWRLGLGQFESQASAQQAVETLSESYQKNHFITRIK